MYIIIPEDLPVEQDMEVEDRDIEDPDPLWSEINVCLCLNFYQMRFKS